MFPGPDTMNAPPPRPTKTQVLLGLLVVWQLLFLLSSNVLSFLSRSRPATEGTMPLATAADRVVEVDRAWSDLTGQWQGWSMYAPFVPVQSAFTTVELRWQDPARPPVLLQSESEPQDPSHYLRPFASSRLPSYEGQLCLAIMAWDTENATRDLGFLRDQLGR